MAVSKARHGMGIVNTNSSDTILFIIPDVYLCGGESSECVECCESGERLHTIPSTSVHYK